MLLIGLMDASSQFLSGARGKGQVCLLFRVLFSGGMAKSHFKQEHDLEKRRAEAARIREKYPDRIPVTEPENCRYLVPADLTGAQFIYVILKRIRLSAEKAIFIFVDNVLPPTAVIMCAIYEEKKDEDGFLYVTYSGENSFGSRIPRRHPRLPRLFPGSTKLYIITIVFTP
ncbi:hypothetical protein SADUNF_Sadunf01G0098400 [Salix dunnii]|uniref:Autophagy-related protein n=1 Tax=Salix dunnii TaxID=1413687 RepID=A0A835NAZ9_9ROSI|nr:hypothetical protein SADUNF_Sadunf01G0098400 [Salix dunnii]